MSWTDPWAYTDALDHLPVALDDESPADRALWEELRLAREQRRATQGNYERLMGERIVLDRGELELRARLESMAKRRTLSLTKK